MKRITVLLSCVVLALAAAPAEAKKKKKKPKRLGPVVTVTAAGNTASGDGQESAATATCPAGKQVVGGGFSSPLVDGSAIIVHDSYRSAVGSWTVVGLSVDGAGAVTAHAYCRNTASHPISDTSISVVLNDSGEVRTLIPSCPSGKLIGGGFQATVPPAGDAVVFPQVNQATLANTWTVTGVARTLTAHAYCMAKIKAPAPVSRATSAAIVDQLGVVTTTTPGCPVPKKPKKKGKRRKKQPKKLLSAGGFSSTINGVPGAPVMVFGESHLGSPGAWLASATNAVNTPGTVSVTSQGICF